MKVINDSDLFVTYKKGKKIGHAESAVLVPDPEQADAFVKQLRRCIWVAGAE